MTTTIRIQREPIEIDPLLAAVRDDAAGAIALFLGTVRDHNDDRRVRSLAYDAYESMAVREMQRIADEIVERHPISRVAIVHRVGALSIGEVAVAVVVSSAHRPEAFAACREVIDTLKRTVPIWKRERFEGGEVWIEGDASVPARSESENGESG